MFSTATRDQKELIDFCRRFLAIKKSATGSLTSRGQMDLVLCSVVHPTDETAGSVIYTLHPQQKDPRVLWSDTLEGLPSVLADKIFGTEEGDRSGNEDTQTGGTCHQNSMYRMFSIKAFPTARLRIELSATDKHPSSGKLLCFFPQLGWVQIVGAIGELDSSGQPLGITFVGRNPAAATQPETQVVSSFFEVSKTVLSSLSTFDKIQMFKQSKFM
jgi:hypothetical protein